MIKSPSKKRASSKRKLNPAQKPIKQDAVQKKKINLISKKGSLLLLPLVLLLFGFLIYSLNIKSGRAGTIYFYPQSCLGNWTNPSLASGTYDPTNPPIITAENSAISDGQKQIFCGGFQGEIVDNIELKQVTLALLWQSGNNSPVDNSQENSQSQILPNDNSNNDSSNNNAADVSGGNSGASEPESIIDGAGASGNPADDPATDAANMPDTSAPSADNPSGSPEAPAGDGADTPAASPDSGAAPAAPADSAPADAAPAAPSGDSGASEGAPTTFNIFELLLRPAMAQELPLDLSAGTTTASTDQGSTTPESADQSPVNIQADFISASEESNDPDAWIIIRYSLDGVTWQKLQTIKKNQPLPDEIDIPLETLEDLAKVQISIETLGADAANPVYLKGMALIARYELLDEQPTELAKVKPDFKNTQIKKLISDSQSGNIAVLFEKAGQLEIQVFYGTENYKNAYVAAPAGEIATSSPLGLKDGYIFWLTSGNQLKGLDLKEQKYITADFAYPAEGESYSYQFNDTWQVVYRPNDFYFASQATGETFSDDNSAIKDGFYKKLLKDLPGGREDLVNLHLRSEKEDNSLPREPVIEPEVIDQSAATATAENIISSSTEDSLSATSSNEQAASSTEAETSEPDPTINAAAGQLETPGENNQDNNSNSNSTDLPGADQTIDSQAN